MEHPVETLLREIFLGPFVSFYRRVKRALTEMVNQG
jgi:hypothetical protein